MTHYLSVRILVRLRVWAGNLLHLDVVPSDAQYEQYEYCSKDRKLSVTQLHSRAPTSFPAVLLSRYQSELNCRGSKKFSTDSFAVSAQKNHHTYDSGWCVFINYTQQWWLYRKILFPSLSSTILHVIHLIRPRLPSLSTISLFQSYHQTMCCARTRGMRC